MFVKSILFGVIVLIMPLTISGQTKKDKIENFVEDIFKEAKEIPGISIAVSKNGMPFYLKTVGHADVNLHQKADTTTAYYIASVTKSFIGILAVMLHQEGIIDLNRPITEYAPIKNFRDKSIFEDVTITDLLSHTSGLKNTLLTWQFADIGNYDRNLLIEILETKTTQLYNNKDYRYDNFGYNVFDLILSEHFNLSWKDLLAERIFEPLNMKHTSASLAYAVGNEWQLAQPYTAINKSRTPTPTSTVKNEATYQAAGGMLSSAADLQDFMSALILAKNGNSSINSEILAHAFTPFANNKRSSIFFKNKAYGLGWNIGTYENNDVFYHLGGFDGYFAHLSIMPSEGIGVAVMVNESHFGDNVGNLIAQYIYDLLLDTEDLESKYGKEKDHVFNRIDRIQNAFSEDREIRSNRVFTLYHAPIEYVGAYSNKYLGNLEISINPQKEINVRLGILRATATPSANDDSIRVEFRDGAGRDILFVSDESGVLAAVYQGYVFLKQ